MFIGLTMVEQQISTVDIESSQWVNSGWLGRYGDDLQSRRGAGVGHQVGFIILI